MLLINEKVRKRHLWKEVFFFFFMKIFLLKIKGFFAFFCKKKEFWHGFCSKNKWIKIFV